MSQLNPASPGQAFVGEFMEHPRPLSLRFTYRWQQTLSQLLSPWQPDSMCTQRSCLPLWFYKLKLRWECNSFPGMSVATISQPPSHLINTRSTVLLYGHALLHSWEPRWWQEEAVLQARLGVRGSELHFLAWICLTVKALQISSQWRGGRGLCFI